MSLINDALKRARLAQDQVPPPPPAGLEFRPPGPSETLKREPSLALTATILIALILAGLLAWQWIHKSSAPASAAGTAAPAQPASAVTVAPPANPAPTPPPAAPPKVSEPPPATTPTPPAASTAPAPAAPVVQETGAVAVAANEPPVVKPMPPRLQGIVYQRTRPSAMISGKTVFVGDKYGDWRVVAISQESATLVGGGLTNVLILPQ